MSMPNIYMTNMKSIMVNIDQELLDKIDQIVSKESRKNTKRAFNRSLWIREALDKQLKIEMGFSYFKKR